MLSRRAKKNLGVWRLVLSRTSVIMSTEHLSRVAIITGVVPTRVSRTNGAAVCKSPTSAYH